MSDQRAPKVQKTNGSADATEGKGQTPAPASVPAAAGAPAAAAAVAAAAEEAIGAGVKRKEPSVGSAAAAAPVAAVAAGEGPAGGGFAGIMAAAAGAASAAAAPKPKAHADRRIALTDTQLIDSIYNAPQRRCYAKLWAPAIVEVLSRPAPQHGLGIFAALKGLAALVAEYAAPLGNACWHPVITKAKDAGAPDTKTADGAAASKFGGTPYLPVSEPYPKCGHCKAPLSFAAQWRIDAMPLEVGPEYSPTGGGVTAEMAVAVALGVSSAAQLQQARTKELLQLFFCTSCLDPDAHGDRHVGRVLTLDLAAPFTCVKPDPAPEENFGTKWITGWRQETDKPDPMEVQETWPGISFVDDNTCEGGGQMAMLDDARLKCRKPDKLSGFLYKDAIFEPVICSKCEPEAKTNGDFTAAQKQHFDAIRNGTKCARDLRSRGVVNGLMEHVFEFASEKGLNFMFSDDGMAAIFQCPKHPGHYAFTWASS